MESVILKNSDLKVSRLCVGGCPMGGYGWGEVSKQQLIEMIHSALDFSVNFFDTADTYGLGESESILGSTLKSKRDKVIIATKFGVRIEDNKTFYDNSPKWIENALKDSLKRLQTEYVDLYQIHYRDDKTPISEVIETLEKLKENGCIRYYGLSNIHANDIEELADYNDKFVSFQNEYSLACRKNEKDFFDLVNLLNLSPLTWGSLGQGILTGKYTKDSKFDTNDRRSKDIYVNFHGEKFRKNLEIVDVMKTISNEINKPVSAIAIRWILDYIPDSVVIAGAKNKDQLFNNTDALGWKLDKKYLKMLDDVSRE